MSALFKLIAQTVVASLIRLWLVTSEYKKSITDRVEISTPLNSWKRVTEGVYLLNENSNPYMGDLIHETPLNLYIYKYMIQYSQKYLPCIFILCDVLTAYFLYLTAREYLFTSYKQQCIMLKDNNEFVKKLGDSDKKNEHLKIITEYTIKLSPTYVFAAYLFNPYVIFNCVAMTTTVFSNLFLAMYLCFLAHRKNLLCCFTLALSATQTFYSVIMIVPILLNLDKEKKINKAKIVFYLFTFASFLVLLQYFSYLLNGGWNYIENTYGFILLILDLQPNIGLWWYTFTVMLPHFSALLISVFQIHATLMYVIPLSIRFRKDPVLLATCLIILTAIFKSYPCIGDVGFCLSLIPIWTYLFRYLERGYVVIGFFLITTVLGPVFWNLWIYNKSANANFYFGVTLAFAIPQIFLIQDLLLAYIKTDFLRRNAGTARIALE